jgi:hypothetical protein
MSTSSYDFGSGPVPAHRHFNESDPLVPGGWVANSANVHPTAYVGARAHISGVARVDSGVQVASGARVGEGAILTSRQDCAVIHWDGYTSTAYPIAGGVMVHIMCECHPIEWWSAEVISSLCHEHEPDHAEEYIAVLTAWIGLVRAMIKPAPAT